MSQPLMKSVRFAPLFWTQFLSAFNDNFLKNTLVFLILFKVADGGAVLISVASAVFIAPFLFLSALGGQIADRSDKAVVAQRLKILEIVGAMLAVAGMAVSNVPVLFAALLVFGVGSALFSPVKYGLLPDHLDRSELTRANAWIEAGTFLAILGGTIAAGLMFSSGNASLLFAPLMIGLALACYAISRKIPSTAIADPDLKADWNILRSSHGILRDLFGDTRLGRTALMTSWFWVVGALVMSLLPVIVNDILGGGELAVTWFLTVFAVSIGIGSALAAWLSAGRIVLLPAVAGTALIAVFALDTALTLSHVVPGVPYAGFTAFLARADVIRLSIDMAGLAIAGALLVVPTFAALQAWAVPERRARTIAGANALGAGLMAVSSGLLAIAQGAGAEPVHVMLVLAVLNAFAGVIMFRFLPTDPLRDLVSIIYRAFFRIEIRGLENLEKAGVAPILALNHVSYLDAGLALTLTEKAPTFAIDYAVARRRWVRPFLKMANALPINPAKPLATRSLIQAVNAGQPMVIFPEGRLTVTGSLMKVYDGAAMVADKTGAMVVPIRIEGLERTPFSYLRPAQIRKRLFPKVTVTILEPEKLAVDEALKGRRRRAAAGARLYDILSGLIFETDLASRQTIIERTVRTAKDRGMSKVAIEDPVTGALTYGKLLTSIAVLGRKLSRIGREGEAIGVMLPNANGATVTTLAVMSAGKVPAMINFTAGATNVVSACRTAKVARVLTSRTFVEQAKLSDLVAALGRDVEVVWLEDIRKDIGLADKLRGLLTRARPLVRRAYTDPAAILFTSGSEGTPKGVVLSHENILANVTQAAARIDFSAEDKVFNVLPMFHSFGLTAGTILPLVSGVPIYMYPSPLHFRIVPELIYSSNATILFGTDTFLNGYARVAHAYDFRSLRYCFAGAEPVKASTRQTYMERFGVRILEGYGVTETAPVIAINTPMFSKPGTVGKIMPGMRSRLEKVPGVKDGGRLFVSGPNVMLGYLRTENPGILQPLADGWHDTGDIVEIDAEGFVTIKGRAKRFAKVGGEMVSLAAVEEIAGTLWPDALSAVATMKDERKGERLILITENKDATRMDFVKFARANGVQDLMVPAEVRIVPRVPLLGTGKVDFIGVSALVSDAREQMPG
ncbi:acyl-[ACP]--phospholipid O-acyltransferase [Labrenzia sp. OB1]|uniref:acyl-[ACP]--phospholipid O-acyltransferase n=1 Tax=Labrenzia sp. OB1 TaxID=1561204 RepID=UPI0007B279BA|nr:acyl-[ACP]--phospholipid O-acyltransferase [Labrenzia sp. OB1]KZM51506.1 2-acyl-glycerophospho-ethanolamine acyltransferase [Labrenzia sp. OB1]